MPTQQLQIELDSILERCKPKPVGEFIEELNAALLSVPSEFRKLVMIELETDGDYDAPQPQLSLYYVRDETEDEARERLERTRNAAKQYRTSEALRAAQMLLGLSQEEKETLWKLLNLDKGL